MSPKTTANRLTVPESPDNVTSATIPAGLSRYGTAKGNTARRIGSLDVIDRCRVSGSPGPRIIETEMTNRMMPPATDSAPGEKCSSRVNSSPSRTRRTATTPAVTSILRLTRFLVAASMLAVTSRKGTAAILGPMPIKRSRKVSMTKAASIDLSSAADEATSTADTRRA